MPSFNDLIGLADRQGVPKTVAWGVINRRPRSAYNSALASE